MERAKADVILQFPVEGDVVIHLFREHWPKPIQLPLQGNWVEMLNERVDEWVSNLHSAGVSFYMFQIFVHTGRVWEARAEWSEREGVTWLRS